MAPPRVARRLARRAAETCGGIAELLIEIRNLTKLYRMGDAVVRALDGVDLTIERGEFVAITGPSGSGKSTMMHLLGCLDRPTAGIFRLNGTDVSAMSDRALAITRNREIGFVFQTFNLINRTSALDNVAVPLFYARRLDTYGPARVALERVNLLRRSGHRPNELSGGERQRVAIARAIVNNPPLLLADEPTGNLDTRTGEQIMAIFHELNRQGVTIVLVTHEYDVALQARRVIQMRDGKIILDKPTHEIAETDFHLRPASGGRLHGAGGAAAALDARAATTGAAAASAPAETQSSDVGKAGRADATGAHPELQISDLPARTMRGANGALAWALAAAALWAGGSVVWGLVDQSLLKPGKQPPPAEAMKLLMMFGLFFFGWLAGLPAVLGARGVFRRMHQEPANWRGRRRAWLALLMGGLILLTPLAITAYRFVR